MEKMIKIYDVNFLELEKAVMWAVTEASTLDRKEFHAMCKDIYYKNMEPSRQDYIDTTLSPKKIHYPISLKARMLPHRMETFQRRRS